VERLAPIPAGLTAVEAAAVPIDGLTPERGLADILHVAAGDQILITAAAVGLRHFAVQIARTLGTVVVATASPRHHVFVHRLGAAVVVDHTDPGWPDQIRKVTDGGAWQVLACAGPTLDGAARTARSGATIATPVHPSLPDTGQVGWQRHDGVPSGSRLIRMEPWFDDGGLSSCPAGTTGRTHRPRIGWWSVGIPGGSPPCSWTTIWPPRPAYDRRVTGSRAGGDYPIWRCMPVVARPTLVTRPDRRQGFGH
jgi:hypothetical protein